MIDIARFLAEINAHFYYCSTIRLIGYQISSVVDLPEGFFGGAVQFKFKDIDIIRRFHDCIGSAFCAAHFRFNILSYQREDYVKNGLIVTLVVVIQLVGHFSEKHLQPLHKRFRISRFKFSAKTGDMKTRCVIRNGRIVGQQKFN